ncbi:hypothetical protein CAOG_01463 [Capsaspora owczarzaki ATCC 30864]|uniref:hypothetical protein n=1 Tax=Capsaspora owczarzaki (strain ATCC 30864) TaxID=595528 RepID=UPI0001FE3FEE|nr:hypothetical protein CAOG_01463 [Capsaspora owczarzaki ATCC 30864]|eukprot:XP_004364331.1 hypothetical protein CAOG_01463 [Capsaspora owczarzaki ATCC 30864]
MLNDDYSDNRNDENDNNDDNDEYHLTWNDSLVSPQVLRALDQIEIAFARQHSPACQDTFVQVSASTDHAQHTLPAITLVSGGAEGADLAMATAAVHAGWCLNVVSFATHRPKLPPSCPPTTVTQLSTNELAACTAGLHRANRTLCRSIERVSPFVFNLLRRNVHVARRATVMLAVAGFEGATRRSITQPAITELLRGAGPSTSSSPLATSACTHRRVAGGTGWTCQVFVDAATDAARTRLHMHERLESGLYVFDQGSNRWHRHALQRVGTGDNDVQSHWDVLPALPPKPLTSQSLFVAGVGTRELNSAGRAAIHDVIEAWSQPRCTK